MIDKAAFHTLSYGLFVIAAKDTNGRMAGCVANTFQQVASDPALVCVSLNKQNATTEAIRQSGTYTVSVLSQAATMELIGAFGFRSSLEFDKFATTTYELDACQLPCITQTCAANFSVRVQQTVDAGSHELFLGTVEEARVLPDAAAPMTYAYYHEVLRGKTPPKAASYQGADAPEGVAVVDAVVANDAANASMAEAQSAAAAATGAAGQKRYAWRCTLCGHIEYVDELPDDFTCPICGVGKSFFERIEVE